MRHLPGTVFSALMLLQFASARLLASALLLFPSLPPHAISFAEYRSLKGSDIANALKPLAFKYLFLYRILQLPSIFAFGLASAGFKDRHNTAALNKQVSVVLFMFRFSLYLNMSFC
jgi:hypothetical protein